MPDLDSPGDESYPSPDRRRPSPHARKGSSPSKARQRIPPNADKTRARQFAPAARTSAQPAFIPSGSSLGLSTDPAYPRHSQEGDSSAVNSSDADGSSANGGSGHQPASHQLQLNERTPLLKKRSHQNQLHQAIVEEEQALYGSSPPDTVPFPRKSPGLSLRKRSSGMKVRRKSSAASRINPQGSSTFGQTLFNAINVLIGIGILALRKFRAFFSCVPCKD